MNVYNVLPRTAPGLCGTTSRDVRSSHTDPGAFLRQGWCILKRGTPEHPKTSLLMSALGIRRYVAVGILESLWHFTMRYAPEGGVGRWTDAAIARAIDYKGNPEALIEALVSSGWLDRDKNYRLIVHDWHEHADQTVHRYIASHKLAFASMKLANNSLPVPYPVPVPVPVPVTTPPQEAAAKATGGNGDGKKRKPDSIWDTICAEFKLHPETKKEKTRVGGIVRDLKIKGATPGIITGRIMAYRTRWPSIDCTPEALLKHWDTLAIPANGDGLTAEQRSSLYD